MKETLNRILDRTDALTTIVGLGLAAATVGNLYGLPRLALWSSVGLGGAATALSWSAEKFRRDREAYEAYANQWMLDQVALLEGNCQTQLQQQLEQFQAQLEAEKKALLAQFGESGQKLKDAEKQSRKQLQALIEENAGLKLDLARVKGELQEAKDTYKGALFNIEQKSRQLDFAAGQLASEKARAEDLFRAEKEKLGRDREWLDRENANFEAKVMAVAEQLQAENKALKAKLAEYLTPARPKIRNNAEALADSLIDLLYGREVLVDFDSAYDVEDKVFIRVKPRPQFGLKDISNCGDAIERHLQTVRPPEFKNIAGCVEIALDFGKAIAKNPIVDPEDGWLETALMQPKDGKLRPNHARFVGESESGKSALVNNCLGILKRHLPDLRVQLGDPLFFSGESNWDFEPTFKDADGCIEGLEAAARLVEERIATPTLTRYPLLYLQDEIDDLVAQFGERTLAAIRKIWKQGRHVGVWLWVLGQSPYAKTLKMGIFDVKNAVNFFIGSTIPKGLGEFVATEDKKEYWLKQFQSRQDSGQEYVCAVFPKRKPGFLTELPKPGTFADSGLLENMVATGSTSSPNLWQELATATEESEFEFKKPELEAVELRIQHLLADGLRPPEVVREIFKLKPSRSQEYRQKLELVKSLAS